ncbi:MAG: Superoxide dismutase [Verrucomicrobia bacterium]|nr:Superoxide dismutase [Verrucomicrobiota bacterium]
MKDMTRQTNGLSRREALKTLGTGAALAGLGFISAKAIGADVATSAPPPVPTSPGKQPFALPKLDYGFDALEPHIDARTMEIHYTKHHQAYVTNANKALADYPDLQNLSAEEILKTLGSMPEKIRTALRNNVGGHANHSLFWKVIGPRSAATPGAELVAAISKSFGSVDSFKTQFADAAMKRFGSGWAWLSLKAGTLGIQPTANQDSPLSDGAVPLLGLDVWEHAYYLHYQNRRADYVAAFWNVVNWTEVEARYRQAAAV